MTNAWPGSPEWNRRIDRAIEPIGDKFGKLRADRDALQACLDEATDLLRGIVEDDCGKLRAKVWLRNRAALSQPEPRCPTCGSDDPVYDHEPSTGFVVHDQRPGGLRCPDPFHQPVSNEDCFCTEPPPHSPNCPVSNEEEK